MKNRNIIGAGLLTAIAASLCCIAPVLALFAGASGIASTFSWLEPVRPYLIALTALLISFAWYQKFKSRAKEKIECACEEDGLPAGACATAGAFGGTRSAKAGKPSFLQSKKFLAIVTLFAALMLAFPYYSHIFFPKTAPKVIVVESNNILQANFDISGMTCKGCEEEIKHEVAQLQGYIEATANHKTGKATVKFDKSKTSLEQIVQAIDKTGYKVTHQEVFKNNYNGLQEERKNH